MEQRVGNKKLKTVYLMVIDGQDSMMPMLFVSTELNNVEPRFVGPGMIDMALHVCQEFFNVLEHGDIDVTVETPPSAQEQQWEEFLQDYYMVVQ